MKTYQTYAPLFPGFYGTIFEYDIESEDIYSYNEENKTNLSYDDFTWDYKDYHSRICRAFVSRLESELNQLLPISIEFEDLVSPKEYNFTNDSINVTVKCDLKKLISLVSKHSDKAKKYFYDKYTSRSGFISFHSNNVNDWLNPKYIMEEQKHRIGALLDCLCSIEFNTEDIYDWCDGESYINFSPKEVTA